jgi:maleate isomerase
VSVPAVQLHPRLAPQAPGIGIVAPFDLALDRELWRWTPEPVSPYLTRTVHLDVPVSMGMAEALGDADALAAACREVAIADPGVTVYLCTSASFVGGLAGEARLRAAMETGGARRAMTTSGAMRELAHVIPRAGADALFLSCTNLPTYDVIPELEAELGLPVLSANLVTLWAALRELGALPERRPERLFGFR